VTTLVSESESFKFVLCSPRLQSIGQANLLISSCTYRYSIRD
jgi:hypothetical protein